MGYELHVRRVVSGDEVEGIAEDEWLQFVANAADFEFQDEVSTTSPPGERITLGGPFGCWTGHPTVNTVPFRWSRGELHVAFADDHAVVGALLVANAFGASVVGDEGESYTEPLGSEPAWEFSDESEGVSDPVPVPADMGDATPQREEVPFNFDGDETFLERVLPWFRRQRRR